MRAKKLLPLILPKIIPIFRSFFLLSPVAFFVDYEENLSQQKRAPTMAPSGLK
jgi:hypothetical protein